MFIRPDNWNELSPLERRKVRLDHWQNTPVEFANHEAEENYKEHIVRLGKTYDKDHRRETSRLHRICKNTVFQ
jgi:hypothetical protein